MRPPRWFIVHSLAAVLVGASGCTSFWESKTTDTALPTLGPSSRPAPELPASETAKVCLVTAEALEKGGKDREAIGLYEKARMIDPNLKHVTRRLAVLYDRTLQHDKAKAEFDKALAMRPNDADVLTDMGYGYYARGLWSEAEKCLRQAVAADPKHARAWTNLGMTLGQRERYDEAMAAFQKSVNPAQAWCNLAFIYTTQGKREDAKNCYRQALQLEPGLQLARTALVRLESPADEARQNPRAVPGKEPAQPIRTVGGAVPRQQPDARRIAHPPPIPAPAPDGGATSEDPN
jgi:Tfp pilus assembly protein PilF